MSKAIIDSDSPNDIVDIYAKPQIKSKILKSDYHKEVRIQIEGPSVGTSIVNAIRRTIMDDIPVYGIHRSNITIDHKRCKYMYNNDLIYCQLETLPIFDIENDFELENPLLYLNSPELREEFGTFVQDIDLDSEIEPFVPKSTKRVELAISYKNTKHEPHYVSTHDVILRIDGEVVDNYRKHPKVDIVVLNPGQEMHVKALATLGIARYHAIWEASTLAIHEKVSPTKYILTYETLGQLDKVVIYRKALRILSAQLTNLRDYVERTVDRVGAKHLEQKLKGIDDTLGGVITETLQKCTLVRKAGFVKDHIFTNTIVLSFQLEDKVTDDPVQVFLDTLTYLINLFDSL